MLGSWPQRVQSMGVGALAMGQQILVRYTEQSRLSSPWPGTEEEEEDTHLMAP